MTILITSTVPVPPHMEEQVKSFLEELRSDLAAAPAPPGTVTTLELIED